MVTIVIAGGGTGGHVFPMIAVGDALCARDASVRVVYVGTARGLEARAIPERGGALELLDILPLRGGGLRGFVRGATRAAGSIPAARKLVRRRARSTAAGAGVASPPPVPATAS